MIGEASIAETPIASFMGAYVPPAPIVRKATVSVGVSVYTNAKAGARAIVRDGVDVSATVTVKANVDG